MESANFCLRNVFRNIPIVEEYTRVPPATSRLANIHLAQPSARSYYIDHYRPGVIITYTPPPTPQISVTWSLLVDREMPRDNKTRHEEGGRLQLIPRALIDPLRNGRNGAGSHMNEGRYATLNQLIPPFLAPDQISLFLTGQVEGGDVENRIGGLNSPRNHYRHDP